MQPPGYRTGFIDRSDRKLNEKRFVERNQNLRLRGQRASRLRRRNYINIWPVDCARSRYNASSSEQPKTPVSASNVRAVTLHILRSSLIQLKLTRINFVLPSGRNFSATLSYSRCRFAEFERIACVMLREINSHTRVYVLDACLSIFVLFRRQV